MLRLRGHDHVPWQRLPRKPSIPANSCAPEHRMFLEATQAPRRTTAAWHDFTPPQHSIGGRGRRKRQDVVVWSIEVPSAAPEFGPPLPRSDQQPIAAPPGPRCPPLLDGGCRMTTPDGHGSQYYGAHLPYHGHLIKAIYSLNVTPKADFLCHVGFRHGFYFRREGWVRSDYVSVRRMRQVT